MFKGIGVFVMINYDIWKNNLEKVFVMMKSFVEKYFNIVIVVIKVLICVGKWLDMLGNCLKVVGIFF